MELKGCIPGCNDWSSPSLLERHTELSPLYPLDSCHPRPGSLLRWNSPHHFLLAPTDLQANNKHTDHLSETRLTSNIPPPTTPPPTIRDTSPHHTSTHNQRYLPPPHFHPQSEIPPPTTPPPTIRDTSPHHTSTHNQRYLPPPHLHPQLKQSMVLKGWYYITFFLYPTI